MNFFTHQDEARRASRRLAGWFALAVAGVVLGVNAATAGVFALLYPPARAAGSLIAFLDALPRFFFATNTAVTLLLILGGAWLEGARLRQGGAALARAFGARLVGADPTDAAERRLRNVAEEMSLAAGAPLPQLYVIDDERSINALAVGQDARHGAVVFTQGALRQLDRDELQGVFAHELAHLVHGDVRLHMRLAAYAAGVQIVFLFGRAIVGWPRGGGATGHGGGSDGAAGGRPSPLRALAGAMLGFAVMAVGGIGWVAARLLQAGVSRQREFLADATAVRLTRLPDGLGNALRKAQLLADADQGSLARRLGHDHLAHAWTLAPDRVRGWLATHPPLAERIRRIFATRLGDPVPRISPLARQTVPAGRSAVPAGALRAAMADARRPQGARALVIGLLQPTAGESLPWASRGAEGGPASGSVGAAAPAPRASSPAPVATSGTGRAPPADAEASPAARYDLERLPPAVRQALLEVAAGTLRQEAAPMRAEVLREARRVIARDGRVTLLEFAFYLVLADRLGDAPVVAPGPRRARSSDVSPALALLVRAAIEWPGASVPSRAKVLQEALLRAERVWDGALPAPLGRFSAREVMRAIRVVGALAPLRQAIAVKAIAAALHGGEGDPDLSQGALLRALCAVWGVPVAPPVPPPARDGRRRRARDPRDPTTIAMPRDAGPAPPVASEEPARLGLD